MSKRNEHKRPKLSGQKRQELSNALDVELRAVFDRHGAGGVVILATSEAYGWIPMLPSWSGMRLEPSGKLVGTLQPADELGCLRLLRFLGAVSRLAVEAAGTMSAILTDIENALGYSYELEEEDEDEETIIESPSV